MTTIRAEKAAPAVRGWAASVAMAATVFTVVTAEMLPVGLLTPIGASLRISEGTAGLSLTVTGVVSALAAPVLPLLLGRLDRRGVMVGLMVLLAGASFLAAAAPTFTILMIARVLMGISLGGVWLLTAGLARRVVPAHAAGPATSLIFSGIGIASVLGIPAGAYVGELAGWRWAFAAVGLLSAVLTVALAILLPSLAAEQTVRFRDVTAVVEIRQFRVGLVLVGLLVTGHFAAYTYVRPLLEEQAGLAPVVISALLLGYGVAGVAGNFVAGLLRPARALGVIGLGIVTAAVLMPLLGTTLAGAGVLLVVWGFSYGGTTVSAQAWGHAAAPGAPEASSAVLVGVFNGAIALGAFTGGQVADRLGTTAVTWLPAVLGAIALLVLRRSGHHRLPG